VPRHHFTSDPNRVNLYHMNPYRVEAFGELVIPKDWVFYTALAARLHRANNEEALQDLINIIARIRRTRATRYYAALGDDITTTLAGRERSVRGIKE